MSLYVCCMFDSRQRAASRARGLWTADASTVIEGRTQTMLASLPVYRVRPAIKRTLSAPGREPSALVCVLSSCL